MFGFRQKKTFKIAIFQYYIEPRKQKDELHRYIIVNSCNYTKFHRNLTLNGKKFEKFDLIF